MIGPAVRIAVRVASAAAQTTAKSNINSTGRLWGIAIPGAECRSATATKGGTTLYYVALALPASTATQRTRIQGLLSAAQTPITHMDQIGAGEEVWPTPALSIRDQVLTGLANDASPVVVP
jgi:hypothetical protein